MADINDAIKTAQDAAGEIVDAEVSEETLPDTSGGYSVPMEKPSMDDMVNQSGVVLKDHTWLKVNEHGIKVGDQKGLIETLTVRILMQADEGFVQKQTIKWGSSPVNYASTYDWKTSDKGGSWPDQIATAMRQDPKAKPYNSVDISMELLEEIKLKDTKVEAGTRLAPSMSMSNFGNWGEFYKECSRAGLIGKEVDVKIAFDEVTSKKNGHSWGVFTFELLGEAGAAEAKAA